MAESTWRGARLAAAHADFWHAARDFDTATLCGMPLQSVGAATLTETHVTAGMAPHAACLAAAAQETRP